MITAQYEYGHPVRLIRNIRNDGSVFGHPKGELLARRGEVGYVRDAGYFLQDQVVYQIHFLEQDMILGCKEVELIDAEKPWVFNEFEYGDKAKLRLALSAGGEIIAKPNTVVDILGVYRPDSEQTNRRSDSNQVEYRIQVADMALVVPERALSAMPEYEYGESYD